MVDLEDSGPAAAAYILAAETARGSSPTEDGTGVQDEAKTPQGS
jgi:hypothetical protein